MRRYPSSSLLTIRDELSLCLCRTSSLVLLVSMRADPAFFPIADSEPSFSADGSAPPRPSCRPITAPGPSRASGCAIVPLRAKHAFGRRAASTATLRGLEYPGSNQAPMGSTRTPIAPGLQRVYQAACRPLCSGAGWLRGSTSSTFQHGSRRDSVSDPRCPARSGLCPVHHAHNQAAIVEGWGRADNNIQHEIHKLHNSPMAASHGGRVRDPGAYRLQ